MSKVTSIKKALSKHHKGPDNSVQASKARKGADTVPAKRKPVVEKGLGQHIVAVMKQSGDSTRTSLQAMLGKSPETLAQAIEEVIACRAADIKGIPSQSSAIGKKRYHSIYAQYSVIIKVLKAIKAGFNLDKIKVASSYAELSAVSAMSGGKQGANPTAQLNGSGFASWDKKTARICTKKDDPEALARLEKHFNSVLAVLIKFEHQTSIPIKDILAMSATPKRSKLRRAA